MRTMSWADEVENTARDREDDNTSTGDRRQWTEARRTPSNWSAGLDSDIRGAAEKAGRKEHYDRGMAARTKHSSRKDATHRCKNDIAKDVHHWFGESGTEESSDDDLENPNNENWSTVDREMKRQEKRRKRRDRDNRRIELITMKARRMAGLGPITEHDINFQMDKTRDYSRAKKWAVKAHLAHYYRYSQDELDSLEILETKRALKDNIIYIALGKERDVKDIYARKAEMRCDKTVVKSYIPPQFYTRFACDQ